MQTWSPRAPPLVKLPLSAQQQSHRDPRNKPGAGRVGRNDSAAGPIKAADSRSYTKTGRSVPPRGSSWTHRPSSSSIVPCSRPIRAPLQGCGRCFSESRHLRLVGRSDVSDRTGAKPRRGSYPSQAARANSHTLASDCACSAGGGSCGAVAASAFACAAFDCACSSAWALNNSSTISEGDREARGQT